MTLKQPSNRLLALDILRGITIAGMILVNNPGSWGHIYAPLEHASWNGLTPTDLVFPFFMFIMGISTYISLRKFEFKLSGDLLWKIVRRTIIIFAIGLGIAWFSKFCYGLASGLTSADNTLPFWTVALNAANSFDTIRILGVMPRLAICYGVASLIAVTVKHNFLPLLIGAILFIYAILLIFGNGYEFSDTNIISIVDHSVLGANHMYSDTIDGLTLKFDPEGFVSTLPSIAHVLIGFWAGIKLMGTKDNYQRITDLFIAGAILTFAGFLLSYCLPINKKIWSPTFVLTTCGLASTLLGLLIWIIDIKGYKTWCRFFEAFGINPLFMYVLGGVLGILSGSIRFPNAEGGFTSLKGLVYNDFLGSFISDETFASLIYALLFIALNWSIGYILYKKKIYIKI
ncbi:MAG: heparan-alpha-glucosaminide N-acetyltransferase domain-containing protein [Muribaculaceae bacterium]|nr:heparan-alpha-glucosaminide N-acetyltransferase domain-containing protein [Muribaculaceae bacterium]